MKRGLTAQSGGKIESGAVLNASSYQSSRNLGLRLYFKKTRNKSNWLDWKSNLASHTEQLNLAEISFANSLDVYSRKLSANSFPKIRTNETLKPGAMICSTMEKDFSETFSALESQHSEQPSSSSSSIYPWVTYMQHSVSALHHTIRSIYITTTSHLAQQRISTHSRHIWILTSLQNCFSRKSPASHHKRAKLSTYRLSAVQLQGDFLTARRAETDYRANNDTNCARTEVQQHSSTPITRIVHIEAEIVSLYTRHVSANRSAIKTTR